MKRHAQAVWEGTLKEGKGTLSTESGAVKSVPYAFSNRFENEPGTNPEELIAAAHAGCFSMAFANGLAGAGIKDARIDTRGEITFEKEEAGWRLKESHLMVNVTAPGSEHAKVEELANAAKAGCPVSNALSIPVRMTLEVQT